jgi:hypothetical protein
VLLVADTTVDCDDRGATFTRDLDGRKTAARREEKIDARADEARYLSTTFMWWAFLFLFWQVKNRGLLEIGYF